MHLGRLALAGLIIGLLGAPAPAADKIVPPAGHAAAPLPTDEPVREGMLAIRELVRINHSLVTHRRMPPDHALRFAAQVKIEAERMLATSKLSGEAQERLRALLAEIVKGVGAVAHPEGDAGATDGLARADEALGRYPKEFDHPGWAPLQSLD
jgi:hypothetical protein